VLERLKAKAAEQNIQVIAAQQLPLDALLLETDSPFGQPENQNTPANVLRVAQIVAELRGMALDELAGACEQNLVGLLER